MRSSTKEQKTLESTYQPEHELMDVNSAKCNPAAYFQEVSDEIDLKTLYNPLETCFENDMMQYCPVLVEVVADKIKEFLGGYRYLLQVWSTKNKEKILQVPLNAKLRVWSLCYRYLIYVIKGQDVIHIVNLEEECATVKVNNLIQDLDIVHIGFSNSNLIIGQKDGKCKVMKISEFQAGLKIDASKETVNAIDVEISLHSIQVEFDEGDFLFILETHDNQLDYNNFQMSDVGTEDFEFSLSQQYERVKRKTLFDPIIKTCYFTTKRGIRYALALRQSGQADIYCNGRRTDTPEGYFLDIMITNETLYFKKTTGEIYYITHDHKDKIKFMSAEQYIEEEMLIPIDFDYLFYAQIRYHCKLYTGFQIIKDFYQGFISHDKFISFFDVGTKKWLNHYEMISEVVGFCSVEYSGTQYPCVALQNGDIYFFDYRGCTSEGLPQQIDISNSLNFHIERVTYDQENASAMFALGIKDGQTQIKGMLKEGNVFTLDQTFYSTENNNITAFSINKELYLMIQNGEAQLLIKKVIFNEDFTEISLEDLHKFTNIDFSGRAHSIVSYDISQSCMIFDEKNCYIIQIEPYQVTIEENVYVLETLMDTKEKATLFLTSESSNFGEGLHYLDVFSTLKFDKLKSVPVASIQSGSYPSIDWVLDFSRLGFIRSLSTLIIIPIPYKNMNQLYTSKYSHQFTLYRTHGLKHYVYVENDQEIKTFDIVSGKEIDSKKTEFNIDGYERFNTRGYATTIYISKEPVDGESKVEDFFEAWQLEKSAKNQTAYRVAIVGKANIHRFIEVTITESGNIEILAEFLYPKLQDLFIITNQKKDRAVTTDLYTSQLYKIVPRPNADHSYQVKLEMIKVLNDFPRDCQTHYKYRLDMFSPDFSKFIAYNDKDEDYFIEDTYTDQILTKIPKRLLSLKDGQDPQMLINKLMWLDDRQIRIASDDGFEQIVDSEDNFKVLSYNQIPLFNQVAGEEWVDFYHIYLSPPNITDQIKFAQRAYQEYKSKMMLFYEDTPVQQIPTKELSQIIARIDFENFECFAHSFTMLQWQTIDEIMSDQIKIEDLGEQLLEQLIYAILPGGNTLLHSLVQKPDQLQKLLEYCHPAGKEIKHHLPFLPNFNKETPLHICLDKKLFRSADLLLKNLKLYDTDHHSRAIKTLYGKMLEVEIPSISQYLESRILQSEDLKQVEKANLKDDAEKFMIGVPIMDDEEFEDLMVDYDENEKKVKIEILDIPGVFHYDNDIQDRFFDSLAGSKKTEYFTLKSIQTLIDFNYPVVKRYLFRKLFLPYCFFHVAYLFTIFYAFEQRFEDNALFLYWPLMILNILFATYYFNNELTQMRTDGVANYFKSFWNYIDIIPLFGIYVIAFISLLETVIYAGVIEERIDETHQRIVISIVTLFMWLKFLYFFRIFDQTSYLIRIVVEVVIDMRHFLLVLLFMIIGFGNSFLVLALGNNTEKTIFIGSFVDSILFSYRMVLGDFDTGEFGETAVPLAWILFLLFTIFNMIVMLNLLIAIISDSYARVAASAEQATYQERASMIAENNYLIPDSVKKSYARSVGLIMVVTNLDQDEPTIGKDPILQEIEKQQTANEQMNERLEGIEWSISEIKELLLQKKNE